MCSSDLFDTDAIAVKISLLFYLHAGSIVQVALQITPSNSFLIASAVFTPNQVVKSVRVRRARVTFCANHVPGADALSYDTIPKSFLHFLIFLCSYLCFHRTAPLTDNRKVCIPEICNAPSCIDRTVFQSRWADNCTDHRIQNTENRGSHPDRSGSALPDCCSARTAKRLSRDKIRRYRVGDKSDSARIPK